MSYPNTIFRNYTDDELINHLDGIGHKSPVITELIYRLEISRGKEKEETDQEEQEVLEICPVCLASLI